LTWTKLKDALSTLSKNLSKRLNAK
jgi:hypothetical protein